MFPVNYFIFTTSVVFKSCFDASLKMESFCWRVAAGAPVATILHARAHCKRARVNGAVSAA